MMIFAKKYKGFSLIELMAVIAIIGIMATVGTVSLQSAVANSRVKAARREVAATIKLAQSYALQGKIQSGVVPCGYGFRFTSTTNYEIFYNPANTAVTDDCMKKNDGRIPGYLEWRSIVESPAAEKGSLKNGVILSLPAINLNDNLTEIYFTNPNAKMFDKGGISYPLAGTDFTFNYSTISKTIHVNATGSVTED